ncbi:hypothetical protein [Tateyamaria omphalii]|uniref:hypothetical protein n=1 Tax=Tateyamaria omphalii TaxID=299262 RepID=UPI0016737D19|nr:hypothetical protein [Tateyamaria omphalii]
MGPATTGVGASTTTGDAAAGAALVAVLAGAMRLDAVLAFEVVFGFAAVDFDVVVRLGAVVLFAADLVVRVAIVASSVLGCSSLA